MGIREFLCAPLLNPTIDFGRAHIGGMTAKRSRKRVASVGELHRIKTEGLERA